MNLWLTLGVMLAVVALASAGEEARVSCVKAPPLDKANAFYVSNKPPLAPSPFVKLPIGAITPRG
ncbi:MAG TPA: hypothetical protein PLE19_01270 [Planctomycetota bacterium]|nr:hypothetical protein [Planctomycetota bacterium]HRR78791.1 hypothetical protein [Planctomycetota bacterium]HRT94946.1 hypothetical protein [Planctomycetota bacterium]